MQKLLQVKPISNRGLASAISQKHTLENLKAIRSTPGMNKWDVKNRSHNKAAEAQIAGKSFNYEATLSQINSRKQWNSWRADLYNKDIAAAKAAGKSKRGSNLQRDLEFQARLVDEEKHSSQCKQNNLISRCFKKYCNTSSSFIRKIS